MSIKKRKKMSDLIEQAGGMVHLAASLDIGQNAVFGWIARKGIPLCYWPEIIRIYGLDPQDLLDINQQIWADNASKGRKKQN